MKLSLKGMAMALGTVWGGAILIVGMANLLWPSYGDVFLRLIDSLYPGYHVGTGFLSVLVGTIYGLLDGAVGGLVFACFYNFFSKSNPPSDR